MDKFTPCRKCYHKKPSSIPDGYYKIKNSDGIEVLKECQHHIEWVKCNHIYNKYLQSGFDKSKFDINYPDDYKGNKSKLSLDRIISYVSKFNDSKVSGAILYLYGPNGTQKTSIANWIGKQILLKDKTASLLTMKSIIDHLWKSERDEAEHAIIEHISDIDLLIIDEAFDSEKALIWESGKQVGLIDNFIRSRINKNKGLIFVSNILIRDIKNKFSNSIQDLIDRETKKYDSALFFEDNYFDNIEQMPERIF